MFKVYDKLSSYVYAVELMYVFFSVWGPPWSSGTALGSESRDRYCCGASFAKISPH